MSQFFENRPVMLLGLEAGVALFLLIFAVIWIMLGAKKHPRPLHVSPDHPSRRDDAAKPS